MSDEEIAAMDRSALLQIVVTGSTARTEGEKDVTPSATARKPPGEVEMQLQLKRAELQLKRMEAEDRKAEREAQDRKAEREIQSRMRQMEIEEREKKAGQKGPDGVRFKSKGTRNEG